VLLEYEIEKEYEVEIEKEKYYVFSILAGKTIKYKIFPL